MSNKEIYEYAIIRLVPKVERGEYLNIGIILFSKRKKYLNMKYHIDRHRILTFSGKVDIDEIIEYLEAWELICIGGDQAGEIGLLEIHERFRWLTAARSTIIQSSEVHPGRSADPGNELQQMFKKYVL